jgi:hypothetical protein
VNISAVFGISEGCRLIDGLSCGLAECGERSRNRKYVFLLVRDAKRIGDEKRALSRYLDRAMCRASESPGALGDKVGIVLHLGRDFIEQFVDCDEAWPTHIPMRCFTCACRLMAAARFLFRSPTDCVRTFSESVSGASANLQVTSANASPI